MGKKYEQVGGDVHEADKKPTTAKNEEEKQRKKKLTT